MGIWTPSIVPSDDQTVYLVVDDFGEHGCAWRETSVEQTDLETAIPSGSLASTPPKAGPATSPTR
jgi:hypothetical protein